VGFKEWFNKLDLFWKIIGVIGGFLTIGGSIIGFLNKEWVKDLFWQVIIFLNDNISPLRVLLLILLLSNFFFVFLFWRIWKYKNHLEKEIAELKNGQKEQEERCSKRAKSLEDKNRKSVDKNTDNMKKYRDLLYVMDSKRLEVLKEYFDQKVDTLLKGIMSGARQSLVDDGFLIKLPSPAHLKNATIAFFKLNNDVRDIIYEHFEGSLLNEIQNG
jgi:hypothetical protein